MIVFLRAFRVRRWLRSLALAIGFGSAAAGCGGGGDGGTGPGGGGGTPAFTISASTNAVTVARGGTGTVTITITRTGGFAGPVSLQPTGQPTGVSALFSAASVPNGQTTSTLTFMVGATAATATTPITVVANGAGVANQSLTIQLTVTAPVQSGPFSMSLSVASFLAQPPTTLPYSPVLTIARTAGFTGAVTVSATGLPAGMVVGFSPSNVTGNTTTLLIINGGAPNGTHNVTLRGVAAGGLGEQSITLPIIVASPSTGPVQWQFCDNGVRTPVWLFAVRDAAGAWTRVVPNGPNSFSFTAAGASSAVAIVTSDDAGTRTTVYQYSPQEMAARAASECMLYPGVTTRTATGTIVGTTAADIVYASMGWWWGSANGPGSYSLQNLPSGPLDLVAVRAAFDLSSNLVLSRGIVRRGANPASGGANAPLDFNAAESFAMAPATWTFGNTNGQAFSVTQMFNTTGGTFGAFTIKPDIDRAPATRAVYGVPLAQTVAGDLHQVVATVATNAAVRATRQIVTYSRTLAARALDFGPALPAPTVSAVTTPAGSAPRLRAQGTLPNEYNTGVTLDFSQPTIARFGTFHTTRAALGAGTTYDVQMPDLTGVTGWDSRFSTGAGTATTWWVSGGGPALDMFDTRYIFSATHARWAGAQTGITVPADGATYFMARALGTLTP